jgi:hypothetical protein
VPDREIGGGNATIKRGQLASGRPVQKTKKKPPSLSRGGFAAYSAWFPGRPAPGWRGGLQGSLLAYMWSIMT